GLPAVDHLHRHAFDHLALGLERGERSVGDVHGDAVGGGEIEHAAGVVAVLVGDEDAAHLRRFEPGTSQPPLGVGERETAIEHHDAAAGLGHQAVARAAAGEGSEAQRYLSCSCSSARMRCEVFEFSALPSLFSTYTWLPAVVPPDSCVT